MKLEQVKSISSAVKQKRQLHNHSQAAAANTYRLLVSKYCKGISNVVTADAVNRKDTVTTSATETDANDHHYINSQPTLSPAYANCAIVIFK